MNGVKRAADVMYTVSFKGKVRANGERCGKEWKQWIFFVHLCVEIVAAVDVVWRTHEFSMYLILSHRG